MVRFLTDMLAGVGPSKALGRDTKMLREILDNTARRVGNDLNHQPEVQAELLNTPGIVCQGKLSEAEPLYRQALEIRSKLLGPEHPDYKSTAAALAALTLLRDMLPGQHQPSGPQPPDAAAPPKKPL